MGQAFEVVIVGGGAAGITMAAIFNKRNKKMKVAIVDPSELHYYQPALTLVGAGVQSLKANTRYQANIIPRLSTWVKDAVTGFDPENNEVLLASGDKLGYQYLIICAGLKCDWESVEGLKEALGSHNVCSNYKPDVAPYTWECLKNARAEDGPAVFTQAPMPIKCPGAPQKIAYLAAHHFKKKRRNISVVFRTATPGIFGVPYYAKELKEVISDWGIDFTPQSNLIKVDGPNKLATFADAEGETTEVKFGMLHVVPSQVAPKFISESALSDDAGWLDVDKNTLQSTKYPNIFGLGDCANSPNSKTAAAIRKQAPVVADNLLAVKHNDEVNASYDGYASCPLTTSYGKVILAEFRYGGQVTPSLPLSPKVSRRSYWYVKTIGLAVLYWDFMLKGFEWDVPHNIDFEED